MVGHDDVGNGTPDKWLDWGGGWLIVAIMCRKKKGSAIVLIVMNDDYSFYTKR